MTTLVHSATRAMAFVAYDMLPEHCSDSGRTVPATLSHRSARSAAPSAREQDRREAAPTEALRGVRTLRALNEGAPEQ